MRQGKAKILNMGVATVALLYGAQLYAQPTSPASGEAQATDNNSIAEIVVTAQKRSERLQDVPLAVQAVTPDTLTKTGADTTATLQNIVPGLNVNDSASGFRPFIRGVGSSTASAGNENSVSTYLDNIYLTSMNAGLLNLSSIESIEVLKGPQGTLFGRNATGGVIHVKTKTPSHEFSGNATVKYDQYQTLTASGYVTGGLTDSLAADLAVYYRDQAKGYGKNLFNGHEVNKDKSYTIRSKILFTPSDSDTITLTGDYSWLRSSGQTYRPIPGSNVQWGGNDPSQPVNTRPYGGPYTFPANGGYWDVDMAIDPRYKQWSWGASLTYEHEFSWATLSSFTAYRKSKIDQAWNATPIPINAQYAGWRQPERQFSQEFQLSSVPSSPVKWILGAYYLSSQVKYDPFFITGLDVAPIQQQFRMTQKIQSPALYGQFTVPVEALGNTNITGGLRYTIDKRSIVGDIEIIPQVTPSGPVQDPTTIIRIVNPTDASKKFKTFTWRLGIDHHLTPDNMVYLTYNRGFKAGSYNAIPPGGPNTQPTNPEYLDAYEIGSKNTLFGGRATLNISAFLYEYRDLQVTIFNQTAATTVNAAKARIKGIDASFDAKVTDNLRLSFSGELLDHKFVKYLNGPILTPQTIAQGGGVVRTFGDLSGKPLPFTANAAFTAGAYYTAPISIGEFDANVNFAYNDGYTYEPSAAIPAKSFVDLSGSIGLKLNNGTTRLSVFGKNLTNAHAPKVVTTGGNPGGYLEIQYRPPRIYGVSISQDF
ncbi:TonB-dependent receptor [Novosphingobium sp.]|uniref:TonB-dependent receptor n=3 Tax=Novosphingobium sp. TaxID=1874826 RepID=UPI002FD9A60C